ncbi:MAG: sialidase family protein [Eubacteriales bacterium]
MNQIIDRKNYRIILDEPELFVDNEARNRSGHAGHAMTEFGDGKIIDFFSDNSPLRANGHACFGWMEYKISDDKGRTWGEIQEFPYSKEEFFGGVTTITVEKAVTCSDGGIIAFCMRNSTFAPICSEPWFTPTYVISRDGGKTWGDPVEFCRFRGRIYDADVIDGNIYVLMFCNDGAVSFTGNRPDHVYRLYRSTDCGESFEEVSIVELNAMGRAYGALQQLSDGTLAVYTYNINNEYEADCILSHDMGKTWERPFTCYLAKGIRNPQVGVIDGVYIMHGRAAHGTGFVLYSSTDGINWDEGFFIEKTKQMCYYSNNIVVNDGGDLKMIIQYSQTYEAARVNIRHITIRIRK